MIGALGMMLGPVIGGVITNYFSWHWIFWVNLPIGIINIMLAMQWLNTNEPQHPPPLDKLGFILFGTALASLTFGLSALSETNISSFISLSIILVSIILLLFYGLHSRNQPHPIIKTNLLRFRSFRIAALGNLISRIGFGGIPFLIPLLLQIGLGFSPQLSGLLLAPTALGVLLAKPCSLWLLRALGYKKLLTINTLLAGLSIWLFISIGAQTPIYAIGLMTMIYGFLLSMQFTAMNSLAYADIPSESLSAATSIMATLQQIALSLGVAVSAIFIRLFSSSLNDNFALTPTIFHYTFFSIGGFTLLSTLIFLRLKQDDGQQMLHPKAE